ncbi:MAG: TetR family transcriptional regulator [Acidimicrobiales bacterium]|nr:TetR family transcriptional regulator [Acidimicrobiales bacterium]
MSSLSAPEVPRRELSGRQTDRVDALLDATLAELRAHGYEGLTVRNAARRAGVGAATAYTYFGSKDHLVAEVFWRRLQTLDGAGSRARTPLGRVQAVLRAMAELVAAEPELASASTTAVLAQEPDVQRLRSRIGAAFNDHLAAALGPDADPAALRALNLALAGALLQAGMGYFSYADLSDRMAEVAALLFREAA